MRVLVISAHPDDETLGCGGTLLKHLERGDGIFWAIVTQAYEPRWSAAAVQSKADEIDAVAAAYRFESCHRLGFPAARLDTVSMDELIDRIREVVSEIGPETVYLVHGGDAHSDHRVVFAATMAVLKAFYLDRLGVRRVMSYESLSSTEAAPHNLSQAFIPNIFCDVTPYIDRKIEIMELYQSEIQQDPMPRTASAIRALARYRGATAGMEYAEAFTLVLELM